MADKITATFYPQVDARGYIRDVGTSDEVDVTERVLELEAEEIRRLKDDDYPSDHLCHELAASHAGPYRVEVEQSLCSFFNVVNTADITPAMIEDARKRLRIGEEKNYEVTVSRTTTRTVSLNIRARSRDEAANNAVEAAANTDFGAASESDPQYEVESIVEAVVRSGMRLR
jgi:hypothetical protein